MQATRPVPWATGPKLDPFQSSALSNGPVELLQEIGRGLHSIVYRARISDTTFAVKVINSKFKFFRATQLVPSEFLDTGLTTVDQALTCNDPFNAECRAYGRLKETGNESLAVKCHGYIHLNTEQEAQIDPFGDRLHRAAWNKRLPLRAIVKDYISSSEPFTRSMLPQMQRDVRSLNRLGIVVYDLRIGNYLDGKIIDFSQARTSPHFELVLDNPLLNIEAVRSLCAVDFENFDEIINDWNREHPQQIYWNRFFPNGHFGRRLRNTARFNTWCSNMNEATSMLDAVHYDWKKATKKMESKDNRSKDSSLPKVTKKKKARRKARR